MNDFFAPLLTFAFIVAVFLTMGFQAYRIHKARRLWAEARSAGLQFTGDFPNVAIKRPQVTFKLEATAISRKSTLYAQAYLAELPRSRRGENDSPELQEALDRAAKEGLRVTIEDHFVTATAEGVALPGEAIVRLNIVEQILRALA